MKINVFVLVPRAFADVNVLCCREIRKGSNKNLTGKILVEFLFCRFIPSVFNYLCILMVFFDLMVAGSVLMCVLLRISFSLLGISNDRVSLPFVYRAN